MRQTQLQAPASPRSRITTIVCFSAIILFLITAALFVYFPFDRPDGGRTSKLELSLALASGACLGFALSCAIRSLTHRRTVSSKMRPGITQHINAAWYDRAQIIAQFGTYEIHISTDMGSETNEWSQEMFRILGRPAEWGAVSSKEYIECYVHPEDRANLRALVHKALRDNESTVAEYRILSSDGLVKHIYDYLEFASEISGEKTFVGQVFDISERKLIEHERLESAARYQAFIEQLGGLQYIGRLDEMGSNVYISDRIEKILGFTADEWCSDAELRVRQLHEDDRAIVLTQFSDHIANGEPLSIDYRLYGKDGALRWFHDEARIVADADGEPLFLQGVMFDITERKLAQHDLERSHNELKKLISALDELREEEQKRLAREMHDDLGQLLAAMKMDLSDLQQYLPQNNAKVLQRLEGINDLVNTMVTSVRRIIADLPPKVLEDLGLIESIRLLASNFQNRYQIRCNLELPSCEIATDQRAATAMYRMAQEALNNVAKHSGATQVTVRIEAQSETLTLCVADNGRGMPPNSQRKSESFGLIGIRQRAATLRGQVRIESEPGFGTAIRILIPSEAHQITEPG